MAALPGSCAHGVPTEGWCSQLIRLRLSNGDGVCLASERWQQYIAAGQREADYSMGQPPGFTAGLTTNGRIDFR
jgi:hypothetical protein